ncbi:flagellin [Novosphingobium sp. PASSN1]|jgi:flagellin|uniref:flagellin N-terminal helical domain-containing protein n=1 Tax=Alphaproteobacteria TaxID=28211 RepID=UPI00078EC57D|nr:flagellin [Novosphingobium sp. PASSN1]AMS28441.1 flagellin [Hyphomonadaceae bacterium UKL13-1]OYU33294.1 MAG: flagellin [Novosphingobium sp. PASSN1]HCP64202.1 flagellin [Hyphomonadaceae bacterium]
MLSVNTNQGAMVALQTLNKTNSDLDKTQNAISTGLKVASAKDNGAIWAIANKMRSDVGAYDRVRESTDRAASILDTGIAAGESIMELLNEMKGKALAGTQAGNSASAQAALAADFAQLRDQITSVIANASFDGANMIQGTPSNAVSLGDAAGGNTITVNGASLALGGTVVTVAAGSVLTDNTTSGTALGLVNASITNLGTQLATWGAGAKRLDVHRTFIGKLQDALNNGIGAIADADLAKESAKLQALQTKSQLGIQALSIANSSSQSALSLFR